LCFCFRDVSGKLKDFENMEYRLSGMFGDVGSTIAPDDGDVNWEDSVHLPAFQNQR